MIISVILGVVVFWKVQGETRYYTWRYSNLKEERDRIEMMKGIVEERYFNRQIDEDTYTKLMREHEEQSVGVISKLQEIQERIKKKPRQKPKKPEKKAEKPKRKKPDKKPEKKQKKKEKEEQKKPKKNDESEKPSDSGKADEPEASSFEEDFQRAKQDEQNLRDMQGL